MDVFTSAIFFIILYSITKPEDMAKGLRQDKPEKNAPSIKKLADLIEDTARYHKNSLTSEDEDDRQEYHDKWEHRLIEIAAIQKAFGDTTKQAFTKRSLDSILYKAYSDSLRIDTADHINTDAAKTRRFQKAVRNYALDHTDGDGDDFNFMGSDISYHTIEQYDSAEHALPDSLRDGWLQHFITRRGIVIRQ